MMKIPLLGDFYSEIGWLFSPISYFQLHQQKPYAGMQGNYAGYMQRKRDGARRIACREREAR